VHPVVTRFSLKCPPQPQRTATTRLMSNIIVRVLLEPRGSSLPCVNREVRRGTLPTSSRSCLPIVTQTVWARPFVFATAILFLLSWVFPIAAGLAKDTSAFPKWWGTVDVAVAFVLAIAAFGIQMLVRGRVDKGVEDAAYRIYRILTNGIIAVAVLVMLAGNRITWENCATGFLWRTWLALYLLPWWLAALRALGVTRA